ncbi:phage tail tape measure protein [Clostridium perfringens]|nr:phage tail tape measure protein [Clostridium perfringens]
MSLNLSFGGKLNKDKVLQQLEKDIKSLSKNLGVELEKVSLKDVDKATSQIQKQINQLSKNINLNISKISLGNNGALQDIQQQINSALKGEKINLEIKNNIKEVSSEFDVLDNKLKNSFLKQEQYLSQLENRLNKIKERSVTQHTKNENYDNSRDLNSIQNIQNRINEIKSKNIRLSQEEKNIIQQQLIELDAYIKKESSKSAEINRSARFLTSQLRSLESLKIRVDNRGGGDKTKQSQLSSELERQINSYKKLIEENKILGSVERQRIQKTTNDMKVQTNELVRYQSQMSNILGRMKDYFIGTSIIGFSVGAIKEGFSTIQEVDTALTDFRKVTDLTKNEYSEFVDFANQKAKELSGSTADFIQSTANFIQMGYQNVNEAKRLAEDSQVYMNVGELTNEEATKSLITILKSFNLEASKSTEILDKTNQVANDFPITVKGLAGGMSRAGSVLKNASNDIDQSIALLTTANTSIQDPIRVSNGLKSIALNLEKVKMKAGKATPKLQDMMMTLTHGRVSLVQANGEFKSTYQIIKDLGAVWNDGTLKANEKALILQEVAGKHQANVLASLLSNAKDLDKIYEDSKNSAGSAEAENERFMDSINGRLNALKENTKGIFLDLSNTDFLKNIISGANASVSALRKIISTVGAFPSVIGATTSAFAMLNKETRKFFVDNNVLGFNKIEKGYSKISQSVNRNIRNQKNLIVTLKSQRAAQDGVSISLGTYANKMVIAEGKMIGFKIAAVSARLATLALEATLSFGLGAIITLAIEGLTKLAGKFITTKSELREFNQDIANSFNSNIEDIKKSEGLVDKINNTKIQINNTSDTQKQNELKKQLLDYEKQLADVLPNAATEFDNEGNAIATNTKLIEENIRQKKQQAKDEVGDFIEKNKKFKEHVDEYIKDQKRLQENQLKLRQIQDSNKGKKWYERTENTTALERDIKKAKEEVKDYSVEINNLIKMKKGLESAGVSKSDIGNIIGQDNLDALDQYNQYLQQTQSSADNAKPSIDNLAEGIEKTGYDAKEAEKELTNLASAFSGLRGEVDVLDKAMSEFQKNGQLSADTIERIFATKDPRLISLLGDQNHFLENSIALEKQLKEERESAYTQEIAQAQYMVQSGIQAENDKTQIAASGSNDRINITNQETQAKMGNYSNDTNAHANSEGTKVANAESGANARTDATANETNQKANMYGQDAQNHGQLEGTKVDNTAKASDAMLNTNSQMFDQLGNNLYGQDANNYENLMNKKLEATKNFASESQKILVKILGSWEQYQYTMADAKVEVESGQFLDEDKLNADIAKLKAMDELKNKQVDFGYNPVKVDYSPKTSSGHSGHKGSGGKGKGSKNGEHVDIKDIEDKIDAYKSLTDAIDDVNNELEITKTLEENAQGANKLQYMNKEINLYKQKKDAINNLIAAKQNEGRYLEGVLKNNGFNVSNGNISNYYDRLKQIEDEVNAMDNSNKAKEEAIKNFKDLKEKADKYFEITSKELPKLNNEWYALAKTIKEVSEKQVKLMGDTEREMTNVVKNQVEERKKALEDETSKIKEELKKQRDEYNKKYDDENFEKNLKEKQDKLNKLNAQIDSVRRDISSEGQSKLKDLLKQKDDLEKELNNFIRDRQKDQGNKAFDEQMDKIDKHKDDKIKEIEKTYTDEKIAELAKGMIQKGFVEIEGHVIKLRDALNDYYKKNGEVFADSSLKMQEYIDNLELTKKLYGELTSINNNLGISSSNIRYNSGNNVIQAIPKVASFMAIPQGSKKANIKIESNLHIGSVHEGKVDDIKSMLDERDRKIINEINEQLNSY